jgi:hypothetical protein
MRTGARAGRVIAIVLGVAASCLAQPWSWQQPNATVLPTGDLQWAPHAFAYQPGANVRYIDFAGGNDANSGTGPTAAFKHHPWDANATGNALACAGINTYIFKRGVIYRGTLIAKESGAAGNPIRLTSDPSWGTGEASILGSERVSTTWTQCTAGDAITNLNPTNVWFTDLSFAIQDNPYGSYPTAANVWTQMVCEMNSDSIVSRISLAKAPNWTITDVNDMMSNWWNVAGPSPTQIRLGATFTQTAASDWIGGSVWCSWGSGSGAGANMATVQQGTISAFATPNCTFDVGTNPGCKYFLENLPQLLDTVNEYYYCAGATHRGRLYLRLSGDRDPNGVAIEVAARCKIVSIVDRHDIAISGLTLGLTNQPRPGTATAAYPEPPHWNDNDGACPAVELGGTVSGIQVSNCKFRYVVAGVSPRRDDQVNPSCYDGVSITDNDLAFVDAQGICLGSSGALGTNRNISVLRNKLYYVGMRQTTRNYSAIPAINVTNATSAEVAGNILDYCAGTGINTSWKTGTGNGSQIRSLVHHNKVTTSLLMCNDYGGIEGWQDGPAFFFCNISGNAVGFRHFSGENVYNPWGHAIYFDHANRHIAFNNIVYGIHNSVASATQRNNSGFMQAVGSTAFYANNTIYKLYRSFCSSSIMSGYVGNLLDDITYVFHEEGNAVAPLAYAKNVYHGTPQSFNNGTQATFAAFQTFLSSGNAESSQLGLQTAAATMIDPANHDFRPTGQAIGNGAKVFLPWNLAQVVGQWNFLAHPADYTTIKGEESPQGGTGNTLRCTGATAANYVMGGLEDWTNGALRFNGTSTYCYATTSASLDMTTTDFIIEVYLRTSASGVVVSKAAANGYTLDIPASGMARMRLLSGGEYNISSTVGVKDGAWHHIVAEVNRTASQVNLYVDGVLSNGATTGAMPAAGVSLTNAAEFDVGKDAGGNFFTGDMDFVRVAKSTFASSATSLAELYAWEFDGPAVRDFAGFKPAGARDAGALQYSVVSVGGTDAEVGMPAASNTSPTEAAAEAFAAEPAAQAVTAPTPSTPASVQQSIDRHLQKYTQHGAPVPSYVVGEASVGNGSGNIAPASQKVTATESVSTVGGVAIADAPATAPAQQSAIPGQAIEQSQETNPAATPAQPNTRERARRGWLAALGVAVAVAAVALGAHTLQSQE